MEISNEVVDHFQTRNLTKREAEIAAATATGLTNLQTASHFFITEKTVKFHLTNVYKKTGIKNRSELVDYVKFKFNLQPVVVEPPKPILKPVGLELPRGEK